MAPTTRTVPPQRASEESAVLRGLVSDGVLTEAQATAVAVALRANRPGPRRWLAEVAGYVGGTLIFGGAAILLATSWDRLTDPARAGLLAGVTALLAASGLAIAGWPAGLRRLRGSGGTVRGRLVGVFFALASGTAAGAAGVLADRHTGSVAAAAGLAVAVAGYALLPNVFGLIASAIFSIVVTVTTVDEQVGGTALRASIALLAVAVCWGVLALAGLLVPRGLALGLAAAIALLGAQQPLAQTGTAGWAYGLTLAVGLACFALYPGQRKAVLLAAGVLAFALAVPEMVWDATNGTAGGAVILLVAGGTLVTASGLGLRLWHGRER